MSRRSESSLLAAAPIPTQSLRRLLHPYHLSLGLVLVLPLGVATIFLSRFAFHLARPEYFERRLPTISKTGAFPPASYVFLSGVGMVSLCVFVTWVLVAWLHRDRLRELPRERPHWRLCRLLSIAAPTVGVVAGLSLGLLTVITLQVSDAGHIFLSIVFFVAQILAFQLDALCLILLGRMREAEYGEAGRLATAGRPAVAAITLTLGLFYLFMFVSKDLGIYHPRILAQGVYVLTEYILATFCFAYASLYYPEVRDHFRARRDPPG